MQVQSVDHYLSGHDGTKQCSDNLIIEVMTAYLYMWGCHINSTIIIRNKLRCTINEVRSETKKEKIRGLGYATRKMNILHFSFNNLLLLTAIIEY